MFIHKIGFKYRWCASCMKKIESGGSPIKGSLLGIRIGRGFPVCRGDVDEDLNEDGEN